MESKGLANELLFLRFIVGFFKFEMRRLKNIISGWDLKLQFYDL